MKGVVRTALVIPFLAMILACDTSRPRDLSTLVRQGDTYLERETMEPYNGPAFELFEEDSTGVRRSGQLADGQWHGTYEEYHPNDQLHLQVSYENGIKRGPYEVYYENGQLRERGSFNESGEMQGPYESYHENGQLRVRGTYVAGQRDGPWETFYDDGQPQMVSREQLGISHGRQEWYYPNGQLKEFWTFSDGELNGPSASYLEDGIVRTSGSYADGERCGAHVNEVIDMMREVLDDVLRSSGDDSLTINHEGPTFAYEPCPFNSMERDSIGRPR